MTERERLIDLLERADDAQKERKPTDMQEFYSNVADHLLANGVILPPVKVGDTVYTNTSVQGWYYRKNNRPYSAKVVFIGINGGECFFNAAFEGGNSLPFNFSDIGKTVFLSREEAEAALNKTDLSAGFRKMG